MSASENVRAKRPLGIYLFTLAYSAPAALVLILTLSALANASMYNENPWDTTHGPIATIASLFVLVSSVATFRGSRIGRACLTGCLGVLLLGMFVASARWGAELRGPLGCSCSIACMVREGWQFGPPIAWVTLVLLYAFHCWYFFGPRTRQFYSAPKNA